MINECACECDALRHAAGQVMRIGAAERSQADQAHELVYFVALFVENAARDEACFDIPTHGQPREQVWILKNETALGARPQNFFIVHKQLAGISKVETGDESKQCPVTTAARPDQHHEAPGGDGT